MIPSLNAIAIWNGGAWVELDAATLATNASVAAAIGAISAPAGVVRRQSASVTLAQQQAQGAVVFAQYNVGATLPANARLLTAEIVVSQASAATGLFMSNVTVQSLGDTPGSILAALSLTATGTKGGAGANRYASRGGQQITAIVQQAGGSMSALTAGAFTVHVYYTIIL